MAYFNTKRRRYLANLRVRGITLSTQNCAQAGSCPHRGLGHINKHNSESSTVRTNTPGCCLLLQDLCESCARGGGVKRGDVCYGMLRATACVDESDHHALMYVWHGQTVREDRVGEASARRP